MTKKKLNGECEFCGGSGLIDNEDGSTSWCPKCGKVEEVKE